MKRIDFYHLACSFILLQGKAAMMPFLSENMGNPLSRHLFGDKPRQALEEIRQEVANLMVATADEIIFTSCGRESNNLVIKGIVSDSQATKKNAAIIRNGVAVMIR